MSSSSTTCSNNLTPFRSCSASMSSQFNSLSDCCLKRTSAIRAAFCVPIMEQIQALILLVHSFVVLIPAAVSADCYSSSSELICLKIVIPKELSKNVMRISCSLPMFSCLIG